jgi:CHAD domain-containing protein
VHDSRVAARRTRSVLRTFGGMFEPAPRDQLAASLRAYAGCLGLVRDLQVLGDVLAEHSSGALAEWAAAQLQRDLAAGWQQVERELDATDHHHLPDQLAAVILSPPREINLGRCARGAAKKAERRLAKAGGDADRLHKARKAAKRARYAAEATGHDHRAHRFKALQDVLGTHHDLVVAADWVDAAPVPDELRDEAAALQARLRADADRARSRVVL